MDDVPSLKLAWADQGYTGKLEQSLPIISRAF
jgi:hypothetical protein